MLQVQVNYWDLQEKIRHDVAIEGYNSAQIALGYANLGETTRHNQVTEAIGWGNLSELTRHNEETESIGKEANRIQDVYVQGTLAIGRMNAMTNRMNALTNSKNAVSNASQARSAAIEAAAANMNALTNQRNAATNETNATTNRRNSYTNRANARINQGNLTLRSYEYQVDALNTYAGMVSSLTSKAGKLGTSLLQ